MRFQCAPMEICEFASGGGGTFHARVNTTFSSSLYLRSRDEDLCNM